MAKQTYNTIDKNNLTFLLNLNQQVISGWHFIFGANSSVCGYCSNYTLRFIHNSKLVLKKKQNCPNLQRPASDTTETTRKTGQPPLLIKLIRWVMKLSIFRLVPAPKSPCIRVFIS